MDALVALGRRLVSDTLIDSGVILDYSKVPDGKGGVSDSWTTRAGAVPCRLVREKDQILSDVGGVVTGPGTPILLVAVGVDFQDRDRIVVNGAGTYQAVGRLHAKSDTTVIQRIIVREV
jgi:hypothetical protein